MIPRPEYLKKLISYKDKDLIKVITGIRRCGKSTLLMLFRDFLLENGISEQNIININLELMRYDKIQDYVSFYQLLKTNLPSQGKCYILLDEIQQVKNWEKAINSINIEADVDIYITGSNAYLLSSEISTLLSGRFVEIKMLPLSFKEFLEFTNLPPELDLYEKFNHYLKFGGLPAVTSLPQNNSTVNEFLLGIYNTVVVKDIISRNYIQDIPLLEQLLKYIITNTSNIVSANKISGYISSQIKRESVKSSTVASYLIMLEKAYIVYQAPRYNIKGKEVLKLLSKYYVVDTGIRNILMGYTDDDIGHVLETIVYFELLRRGYQVFVGKWNEIEVDFVAIKQEEKRYYQVSYSLMNDVVKKRELASLKVINDNYEKILLSMDRTYITDNEGIKFQNIIDFLLS